MLKFFHGKSERSQYMQMLIQECRNMDNIKFEGQKKAYVKYKNEMHRSAASTFAAPASD